MNGLVQRISPPPLPGMVHVTFVAVQGTASSDTVVVEVRVAPGLSKHQPIPYESSDRQIAYLKLAGGTVNMAGPQRISLYEAAKRGKHGKTLKSLQRQQPKLSKQHSSSSTTSTSGSTSASSTARKSAKMCTIL